MNRIKTLTGSLKRIAESLLGKELDTNTRMGLVDRIAEDIAEDISENCFGHGDLGGGINAIRFFIDDPVRASFVEGEEGRRLLSERLRREKIKELGPLADGIVSGQVDVRPLSEADGGGDRIHTVKTDGGPVIRYEVYTRPNDTDCIITFDTDDVKTATIRLSETEPVLGQYPFGRKSDRPKRTNSFHLPEGWKDTSRTQGIIRLERGSWYLIPQSQTQIKLNGYPTSLGKAEKLVGEGSLQINEHQLSYRIAPREEAKG